MKLKHKRSACPIASCLDFFGDKWTLVIVRDMFIGKNKFSELEGSPEGVPTNILADRLRMLEVAGVVKKRRYSNHRDRYEYALTRRGRDLLPVLQEMARWGRNHVSRAANPPDWFWNAKPEDFAPTRPSFRHHRPLS